MITGWGYIGQRMEESISGNDWPNRRVRSSFTPTDRSEVFGLCLTVVMKTHYGDDVSPSGRHLALDTYS